MTAPSSIDPARFLHGQLASASPDLLRSMLTTFVNTLMPAEADVICGAPYRVPGPDRVNVRNCRLSVAWIDIQAMISVLRRTPLMAGRATRDTPTKISARRRADIDGIKGFADITFDPRLFDGSASLVSRLSCLLQPASRRCRRLVRGQRT